MTTIFGIAPDMQLLIATIVLFGLWWCSRSPKLKHDGTVCMKIFCLRCNWEGKVPRNDCKCGACGYKQVRVLAA